MDFMNVKLPSKCLPYKDVDPDGIMIRQLTGREERVLSEVTVSNLNQKVLEVLKEVVTGVDPKNLTIGDRLFILIWEVMNSFSDDFPISYICTSCLKKVDGFVKLSQIELIELSDDYKEPVPVTLSSGAVVNLRLLTSQDEVLVSDYKNAGQEEWTYRYALSIVNESKDIMELMSFYESLPIKDTAKIRAFQEKYYHGPDMEATHQCPYCHEEDQISIPFRIEALFPTGKELVRNFGDRI